MSHFQFILHSATNLPKADVVGTIDAYAVIKIPCETCVKEYVTPFINDDENPVWNFECPSEIYMNTNDEITVEIWDKDTFTRDDFVANCQISISNILACPFKEKTIILKCVDDYTPYDKSKPATVTISAFYKSFRN
ncbi:predicted protein [Naegleria gruberi]|uniref:Predicted protein n=1 Tax=Naegleria gruberi TaxID=5762 RepID=D2VTS1_NAEGR|nr:uncharacterized protein NAEGRDRAFT_72403 [Naegleria gruberi]EFC39704.1 predicted protein [Naegleria gruberi]|eukprot:XP_002672448.1 predicted protein [Naegleria gruberi strain NEG-M]